ncbi:hypothetical protein BW730_12575 [Tessaracoccus aquimaris]|uniref:Sensory rhodopsin transducer n=1 Tax=Tessaracoccus aquimaris TaxID=1332264 RepID=A0A1Q2CQ31_9ACTN|nr:sensory rhodopsin transducer [Tessaracoccus aquimaris]AQP48213.1 hypothetical protein BW730_12575 [Tessaracoccus aquimaris]
MTGRTTWVFPDAELPPYGPGGELYGHESIIVLNTNLAPVAVRATLWYTDKAPAQFEFRVEGQRVRCLRTNEPSDMGGVEVPVGEQYAISLSADAPIVAQYGRLDVRQPEMAFYTTPGYSE